MCRHELAKFDVSGMCVGGPASTAEDVIQSGMEDVGEGIVVSGSGGRHNIYIAEKLENGKSGARVE